MAANLATPFAEVGQALKAKKINDKLTEIVRNLSKSDRVMDYLNRDAAKAYGLFSKKGWVDPCDMIERQGMAQGELISNVLTDYVVEATKLHVAHPDWDYPKVMLEAKKALGKIEVNDIKPVFDYYRGTLSREFKYTKGEKTFSVRIGPKDQFNHWYEGALFSDFDVTFNAYLKARHLGIDVLTKNGVASSTYYWEDSTDAITGKDYDEKTGRKLGGRGVDTNPEMLTDYEMEHGKQEPGIVGNVIFKVEQFLKILPTYELRKLANEKSVDFNALASTMWDSIPLEEIIGEIASSSRTRQSSEPMLYAEAMTLAVLPVIRYLHENGINDVVIADRGNRPAGIVLEEIVKELDLGINVHYAKISNLKKVSEGYMFTDEFANSVQNPDYIMSLVRELRILKDDEDKKETSDGERLKIRQRISEIGEALKPYYEQTKEKVKELYKEGLAKHVTVDHSNFVVFDDFIKSGSARAATIDALTGLGYDVDEGKFIAMINTDGNKSGAFAINLGNMFDPKKDTDWQTMLEYHHKQLEIGVTYGMDEETVDQSKLFERWRIIDHYKLQAPKDKFFTAEEAMGIAKDIRQNYVINGHSLFFAVDLIGREWSEDLQRDVNFKITDFYRQRLVDGIKSTLDKAERVNVKQFIEGHKVDRLERYVMDLQERLRDAA
jgi:hypothetical protein